MPEFLRLLAPDEARSLLLAHLAPHETVAEPIDTAASTGRVTAEDILAPHALPEFRRSTVDGYAVQAQDTFGASDANPAYLILAGEIPMGDAPPFQLLRGQCALIHTGGMLPDEANAVVMLEHTQFVHQDELGRKKKKDSLSSDSQRTDEIELLRAVAEGENVIAKGEDVSAGMVVVPKGRRMRPAEIGGLMALGITTLRVVKKIRVGLISSGDEVVEPDRRPRPGQVRDVNAYTLASLIAKSGGAPELYGIVPDHMDALKLAAEKALTECELVIITAGSSASTRDMTAAVIDSLGKPGVLVHGINTRPGKPTILGVCNGKGIIGLPGNPVSALVNGYLFVLPVIEKLLGLPQDRARTSVMAQVSVNLSSQAGREDWWPVRLIRPSAQKGEMGTGEAGWIAEPIFGKSNLIFTLAAADGLLRIPPEVTGLSAGEIVEVFVI